MAIINKGILNSKTAYLRQLGNDWPTAQVVYTADILESTSNLYFTNARVFDAVTIGTIPGSLAVTGNLVANGLIIRNIVVADSVLLGSGGISGNIFTANVIESASNLYFTAARVNATVQPFLTSANVTESAGNLYFTNSRVVSALSAGQGIAISPGGVISYKQTDPGLGVYNSGLTLASAAVTSNIYSNLVTFSSLDGVSFLVQSLHVTNISPNVAYLNGRINFNYSSFSNSVVFANLLEIPGASSMELFFKPITFKVGDQIQLQSFRTPTQPANSLISAMVSYQGSTITEYDREGTSLTSNSMSNVFTSVGKNSIVESIKVVNPNPRPATITVQIVDNTGSVFAYLASNLFIPSFSSIEVCEFPKVLSTDYTIRAQKTIGFGQPINIFTSTKYTSYYVTNISSASIGEGASNTITIDFQTLGVTNGTTFYYSIDGNVSGTDFVSGANTGSFVVTGDQGVINLQIASDTGFEGEEQFRVQVRKNSVTGTILSSTANITIRDTTNTQAFAFSNANSVDEGNTIAIGVTVFNPTNGANAFYYSTKNMAGNVFASRFSSANTGAFIMVNNANTINLVANADGITSINGIFQLDIRTGSTTGPIVATSSNIALIDTSTYGPRVLVNGATSVVSDGTYTTAIFTTSGNIQVLGLGAANNLIDYTVVAGGGGTYFQEAGGGGAGGFLNSSLILPQANNYIVVVGGGGGAPGAAGVPGTSSYIRGASANIFAWGGGGSATSQNASPGGSGGGGRYNWSEGTGTPGQGNPGGVSNQPGWGGSGGGAGGAGSSYPAGGGGGVGAISPLAPPAYGTSGPTAGRWFAGGGAGYWPGTQKPGGAGGGGNAYIGSNPVQDVSGAVNTGGGAGAGAALHPAIGFGGSGIVIIRYRP